MRDTTWYAKRFVEHHQLFWGNLCVQPVDEAVVVEPRAVIR